MIFWARPRYEWQLRTRRVLLGECTRIMAVISLSQADAASSAAHAPAWAKLAVAQAVEAVDAESDLIELTSGPAHTPPPSAALEQSRLLPVLEGLMQARPEAVVAVDAHYAETARAAIRAGAEIVNDLSGPGGNGLGSNEAMAEVVAQSGCGLVLRHMRSREAMADGPLANDEVVPDVFGGLCERMMLAECAGIEADQIVADAGFGRSFLVQHGGAGEDFALLAGLGRLRQLGRPLLLGVPLTELSTDATRAPGSVATVAAHVTAILAGAHLLRVHDVKTAREAISVADAVLEAGSRE